MTEIKGIDVSKHQTSVDFKKVKKEGFEFAIIRCGYRGYGSGKVTTDERWSQHVKNAIASKMPYGVYFFSQAITVAEAIEEAKYTLKLVKAQSVQPVYPIYIDTEWANKNHTGRADSLTKAQRTAIVKAFCAEIEKAGYYAGIYASTSWFTYQLNDNELTRYDKWIAQYATECEYKGDYGMWQYGGSENHLRSPKVNGVSSEACDQNYCYIDYPTTIKKKGLNGYKPVKKTYKVGPMSAANAKQVKALADKLKVKCTEV